MNDLSASGSTGAPSGVNVGGTRNCGLWDVLSCEGMYDFHTPGRIERRGTYDGGEAGDLTITVVFQLAISIRRGIACAIEHAALLGTPVSQ
jgi:hypothetical protein